MSEQTRPASQGWTARSLVPLLAGVVLVLSYWTLAGQLPRGEQEFAYHPAFMAHLPFSPMRGFTVEQLARHLGWTFLLGPGLALVALGLARAPGLVLRPPTANARLVWMAAALGLAVSATVMLGVLRGREIIDDEQTYAMQARLLARGMLGDPNLPNVSTEIFTVPSKVGWTGKYLFGEPLVQVVGTWFERPALMHLPLYALAVAAFFAAVRREAGLTVATWSAVLLALSPMVLLTTATGLSHTTCLAAMAVAGLGVVLARQDRPWLGAALVALGVGFGIWVRVQNAVPFGGILVVQAIWALLSRRRPGPLLLAALIGGAMLGVVALYNQALTGSPTSLPWSLQPDPEAYGFGPPWHGVTLYIHTPTRALENTAVSLIRMNQWWLGWPLSFALVALWARWGRPAQAVWTWWGSGLALIAFYLGYYSTGVSDTGPIYWFDLVLPLAVLGGHAVAQALERAPALATVGLVVHLGLGTAPFLAEQGARLGREADTIRDEVDALLADVPRPTLVIYEVPPSATRQMGWVFGYFPILRHEGDLVTVPNIPNPGQLERIFAAFPNRSCVYMRVRPSTGRWLRMACDKAETLMRAPNPAGTRHQDLTPLSTAMKLGWLPRPPFKPGDIP